MGMVGVWIFFVLSAFLLTAHLSQDFTIAPSKTLSLLQYFIRRIFRIYPLLLFVLLGHILIGHISSTEVGKHILLMQTYGEIWTIAVEFRYYIILPIIIIGICYLPKNRMILILMAILAFTLLHGMLLPREVFATNHLGLLPKFTPFLFGGILAILFNKQKPLNKKIPLFVQAIPLVAIIIATLLHRSWMRGYIEVSFTPWLSILHSASVTGLIYMALQPTFIKRLLAIKPLVFFGEISFSVYLLHIFIINNIREITFLPNIAQAWLSFGFCILFGYVTYLAIEKPGILLGKIIVQKIRTIYPQREPSPAK